MHIDLFSHRQQAKVFEERMANVFSGVDGAPSGDQINLTFQKMAGMIELKYVKKYFYLIPKLISNRGGSESSPGTR